MIIRNTQNNIIVNDEYVGEILKNKKILNNNHKNIIRVKSPNIKYQYGNIIEERKNYLFYVSGVEYIKLNNNDDENGNKIFFKTIQAQRNKDNKYNNSRCYRNCYSHLNNKNKDNIINISNSNEINNNNENDNLTYEQEFSFYFNNIGIIKDSSQGFYKIYQAIPLDINDQQIEIPKNKTHYYLINNYKKIYGNKNNFVINSNDIDQKKTNDFVFEKKLIKRKKNLIKGDETNDILQSKNKIKSLYFKNRAITPFKRSNNSHQKTKRINNNDITNQKQKKLFGESYGFVNPKIYKKIKNNNYIEINESKS